MTDSPEAKTFTDTLLSTVRLQRHLGTRIVVSTQEPTVSEALLDLSSVTIVHRFTSPDWLRSLERHVGAVALASVTKSHSKTKTAVSRDLDDPVRGTGNRMSPVFEEIVGLKVGEALVFSPTAMIGFDKVPDEGVMIRRLGLDYIKVRVRARITDDGGKSVLAKG